MRKMLKYRWIILIIWLIVTVLFTINQPNLKQILNQKGQVSISNDSPSKIASQMLNKMGTSKGDTALFVFGGKNKLTDEDMKDVEKGIDNLKSKKESLRINNIIDPFGTPEAKDQLVSKDGTTLIVQVTYEKGTRDSETIMKGFEDTIKNVKLEHYITGELAINRDYLKATNEGVDKSSIITVIFILLVLIIMFRSVVTPFVSLIAVAVSYLCSMGVIGILINTVDFPITSLTQMFIIIILFGIGTDYNILLFNRFKEELGKGFSVDDAVVNTFRTAGKTIIFSGMTVFIAFASLSFVQFPIYRSANAVAIGIAVLLLELMTLTPIIMKLLARKFFWPSHKSAGHKESKFWDKVTSVSVKHPAISLLVVAIIIAPVIIFNTQKLSFDSLKDMSSDTPSVKGFNIVADKFGRGKAMPTTVVLENNEAMDNNDALAVIDNLTEKLKKLKGVKEVSGATQPKGEQITSFYTNTQTKTVVEGLSAANGGVGKIYDGLDKIKSNLSAPDFSKANDLVKGTEKIQKGMEAIKDGLDKVNGGIDKGAGGSEQLGGGIAKLKSGVTKINEGVKNISDNLSQINEGYKALGEGYKALPGSITQIKQIVTMMQGTIGKIDSKLPNDSDVASLKAMLGKLSGALDSMSAGITKANANFDTLTAGLSKLSGGLKSIEESTSANSELVKGIDQLEKEVLEGLKQGSSGQKKIIDNMSQLIAATMKIKYGQSELSKGLNGLGSGMAQLKDGIDKSSNGLKTISDGIGKTNTFLTQLTNTKSFYIPSEAFGNENITKMLDAYMSKDRKIAKLTINLDSDPYSPDAISVIEDINNLVKEQIKGTNLADAQFGITGPTSNTYDLNKVATHDIKFTQVIVLIAIFILLVIVIRSFWIPLYIIASLITAYYAAISVTAFLTSKLFSGMDGMSWNVPFFSFVMIAALGVDYSIFLMTRFKEYPDLSPKDAIVMAAKNVGGVVMSAAIILAGTFATLYPSNLHVLMEMAICVVTGLLLLSVIMLPVAIPALMSITDKAKEKTVGESFQYRMDS